MGEMYIVGQWDSEGTLTLFSWTTLTAEAPYSKNLLKVHLNNYKGPLQLKLS